MSYTKDDLLRAFAAGFSESSEGFNRECNSTQDGCSTDDIIRHMTDSSAGDLGRLSLAFEELVRNLDDCHPAPPA